MQRRSFLSGMVATAAGLLVPDEMHQRVRIYSFIKRRPGKAKLQIFGGAQPLNPDMAVTRETLLSEIELTATAFPRGRVDVCGQDSSCDGTGTATWARYLDGFGAPLLDVPVVTPEEQRDGLVLNTPHLITGYAVSIHATLGGLPIDASELLAVEPHRLVGLV